MNTENQEKIRAKGKSPEFQNVSVTRKRKVSSSWDRYIARKNISYLYSRYFKYFCRYLIQNKGVNANTAKDMVSDAFYTLLIQPHLVRMVEMFQYLQDLIVKRHSCTSDELNIYYTNEFEAIESLVENETPDMGELMPIIRQLVEKLPPQRKRIFQGYFFQEKTTEQIAIEMGLSEQTVRNQKISAVQDLKMLLKNTGAIW